MTTSSGRRIGRYDITSPLGAGGMGEVFLARDTQLDRNVALKLLAEEFTKNQDRMGRFVQEAKAASALNHPNIIIIHEIGESEGAHFIATEYIEGETLRDVMKRKQPKIEQVIDIGMQAANALTAAHKANIVHRDIKPENIMVRPDGYVKVLDFGLAKLSENADGLNSSSDINTKMYVKTNPGAVMGTTSYMSPEQAKGMPSIDSRTDVFSLGIVLYEMLTGTLPFNGSTPGEVIGAIMYEAPKPIARYTTECPPELDRIVTKALQKDPEDRYQLVRELATDLKSLRRKIDFESDLERSVIPNKEELPSRPPDRLSFAQDISTTSAGNRDALLLTEFVNLTGDQVFDGTLNIALAITLEQSPFLEIFNDAKVRHALRLMDRDPNERITRELGREICMRQSLKAYITGTITSLGSNFVITLEAVNGRNGDVIGRQLEQTDSKEKVLQALGQAATGLREKLGESLSSIDMFDAPLQEATTSSIEAFKAYSLFLEYYREGKTVEALPFAKRALTLDPNFASAYVMLAIMYNNTGQPKLAAEYASKAYELTDKVSEYEKLRITHFYHRIVTGTTEKSIETLKLYKRAYPRDAIPPVVLSDQYEAIGQFEKAVDEARDGIRLNPYYAIAIQNLCTAQLRLNQFDEVKKHCDEAFERGMDGDYFHELLYLVAFVENETEAMSVQTSWFHGRDDEYIALNLQSGAAAFAGRWRTSQDFSRRAIEAALRSEASELAAEYAADQAIRMVCWSNGDLIPSSNDSKLKLPLHTQVKKSLQYARNKVALSRAALALSFAGYRDEAEALFVEIKTEYPNNTLLNQLWIPFARAGGFLQAGKYDAAVAELEATERYERSGLYFPQYFRGLSYFGLGRTSDAIKEFDRILDHRGEAPLSSVYPLAQLARARVLKEKGEYEKFFELWNEADPDMPALISAKHEYALLA
ncbi:MAG: protein kinase domain-containing protein [Pyrinomonadaceae bacterium]